MHFISFMNSTANVFTRTTKEEENNMHTDEQVSMNPRSCSVKSAEKSSRSFIAEFVYQYSLNM